MLKPDDTIQVIIDVQGKLATLMHQREQLYRNLEILIRGIRVLELPILWLEQHPEGLGPTIPEIADLLRDLKPLPKLSFSACGQDDFLENLRSSGRQQILLAGIETHVCVYQTARDLLEQDYHVEVVVDATSSRTPENKQVGLDKMACAGAGMSSVEIALFELLGTADAPQFKEILRLLK